MDKKKNNKNKISLGMLKGKPITSSVPSIAIRFNATDEEIEELYVSEGDHVEPVTDSGVFNSDIEGSPFKVAHSPKFSKRSISIDVSNVSDSSPPSDPWRFFSDIKGKITKSVEGRLTEYKTRTGEGENSPKIFKSNKEARKESLSDSEEFSESSISRTCGIVSTTEGAEMSSDDETTSLSEKEKRDSKDAETASGIRRRDAIVREKSEGSVSIAFLKNLQNINVGLESDECNDVESGIDALSQIDNVELVGEGIAIKEVRGDDIRDNFFSSTTPKESTTFAPTGFVDLRPSESRTTWYSLLYRVYILSLIGVTIYSVVPLNSYMYGFIAGNLIMLTCSVFYIKWFLVDPVVIPQTYLNEKNILEIPSVREYHPVRKYQGWVNEYPEKYDPHTYHISQTQSVYLRLQGNLLKISHTRAKIPKRAMWNESEHKTVFVRHRIYNLLGAKVNLLPVGLTKIRHWSKKYPICITLDKNQLKHDTTFRRGEKRKSSDESMLDNISVGTNYSAKSNLQSQVFSKLNDEGKNVEQVYMNAEEPVDNNDGSPIPQLFDDILDQSDPDLNECESNVDDLQEYDISILDDWTGLEEDSDDNTCIYIFARTAREKEHWFRRLIGATHNFEDEDPSANASLLLHEEYLKYMSKCFLAANSNTTEDDKSDQSDRDFNDMLWINSLISRISFDLIRSSAFNTKIKERIQRKLSSIKLPYFIEELTITELSLGRTAPFIRSAQKPVMDERGLWFDLDVNYEGQVVVILQTKLNLMKLKHPQTAPVGIGTLKSAIFHSDVDDTAESSSDEENTIPFPSNTPQNVLDSGGHPVPGLGGTSNKSKRLIRMVDRIAETRLFQAAAENKYIKKAIEGVSNTDLGLKVELKFLEGCLAVNVPVPPSDRIWVGFRPSPKLHLLAQPIVGERNINFLHVTNWIEKKLYKEFQKVLVIPNMEDLYIPLMSQMLPE